jgi:hypothetical protein
MPSKYELTHIDRAHDKHMDEKTRALLLEAVEAWADQFDGDPDTDLNISGADFIEWFARWRIEAKALLA